MVVDISEQVDNYSAAKQFLCSYRTHRDAQDLDLSCSVLEIRAHYFKILQDFKTKCYMLCHFSALL